MEQRPKYMWVKKFGDVHYPKGNITLCGIPMLGNNYNNERPEVPICKECEHYLKLTDEK